jgi:cyclopropane-fatty-acyl-phospholipid synthase
MGEMLTVAERAGFEIRALENLRHHYRLTLRCWVRRLEDHAEEARQIVGETNFRIWGLYLAGSAHYFKRGRLGLYESLLAKN